MPRDAYSDAVRIRIEPDLRPRLEQMAAAEHLRLSEFVRRELRRLASRSNRDGQPSEVAHRG